MRQFVFGLLLVLAFSLTGCFEVIEEISLNDDGSGNITMTVNISKSKTKLNSIMLMDSINNYKVPTKADIRQNMKKMIAEVEKIEGVSNVQHQIDFEDFIFSVSCDFESVNVLNKVITHFSTEKHAAEVRENKQFSYDKSKKIFKRNYHYNLSKEINKVQQKDRQVLDGASVTTIYRFESPIESSANNGAKIAGSKKAIMLKVDVNEMIMDRQNIKNTISLQ